MKTFIWWFHFVQRGGCHIEHPITFGHLVSFSKADSLSDAAHLEMHEPPSQRMGLLTPPGFQKQIPLYFSAKQVCYTSGYEPHTGSSSSNSAAEDAYTCPRGSGLSFGGGFALKCPGGGVWFVRGALRGRLCPGCVWGGGTRPRTSGPPPHNPPHRYASRPDPRRFPYLTGTFSAI